MRRAPRRGTLLRGAGGGNIGVVTSFVFRTLPAPAATVFHLAWRLAHAAALVQAWQAWAPTGPDELHATLRLTASGDAERPPMVDLLGAVLGSDANAAELLDELVARAGADRALASRRHTLYREAKRYLDELGSGDVDRHDQASPDQARRQGHLFTKSEFFRRPLPREAIAALVENLFRRLAPAVARGGLTPWGGAYNRQAERYQRILAEEVLYARDYLCEQQRSAAIAVWNIHYNYHRPHNAAGGRPPASRLKTGVTNVRPSYS
jgi:FAD/FMN-containing dehydrogenase